MNKKHNIYIGLGTNLGNLEENLNKAIDLIQINYKIKSKSNLYYSEPLGFESTNHFLNSVICIESTDHVESIFSFLKDIENQMGRIKTKNEGYEDRVIDLDILFYNDLIFSNEMITIPHKEIINRRFVLEPMNEIASHFIHPVLKKTIFSLLDVCKDNTTLKQKNYNL